MTPPRRVAIVRARAQLGALEAQVAPSTEQLAQSRAAAADPAVVTQAAERMRALDGDMQALQRQLRALDGAAAAARARRTDAESAAADALRQRQMATARAAAEVEAVRARQNDIQEVRRAQHRGARVTRMLAWVRRTW